MGSLETERLEYDVVGDSSDREHPIVYALVSWKIGFDKMFDEHGRAI